MRFTKGTTKDAGDDYARVYDRLRKRSYRHERGSPSYGADAAFYGDVMLHAAYVRGVKDALSAMVAIDDEWAAAWLDREIL